MDGLKDAFTTAPVLARLGYGRDVIAESDAPDYTLPECSLGTATTARTPCCLLEEALSDRVQPMTRSE